MDTNNVNETDSQNMCQDTQHPNPLVSRHDSAPSDADKAAHLLKTPQPLSWELKSQQSWAQQITDSGFSSAHRGTFSDRSRSTSVSCSLQSSPESVKRGCSRRVTLANCDFSPVTRESFSVIRSRKLSFNTSDPLPRPSRIEYDQNASSAESLCSSRESGNEKDCEDDETKYFGSRLSTSRAPSQGDYDEERNVNSTSPVSPGLFLFDKDVMVSRRVARLSSEEASLESSLQDMSLEESSSSFSSSSSSRSHSISISPTPDVLALVSSSDQCAELRVTGKPNDNMQHTLPDLPTPDCVDDTGLLHHASVLLDGKGDFMSALKLALVQTTTLKTSSSPLGFVKDPLNVFLPVSSLSASQTSQSHLVSHNLTNLVPTEDTFYQDDTLLMRSPYKRIGPVAVEHDLLSPTKLRKTVDAGSKLHAARNIFHSDKECSISSASRTQVVPHPLVSCQPASHSFHACTCKSECANISDSLCAKSTPKSSTCKSYLLTTLQGSAPTDGNRLPKDLLAVIEKLSPREPSRLIGRNVGVEKFDIVASLNEHFCLCLAQIFSHLSDKDLVTVSMVSQGWLQSLKNDKASYTRYRNHLQELSRKKSLVHAVQKENYAAKLEPNNSESFTPMTKSKGCLAVVQAQVELKTPQPSSVQKVTPVSATSNLHYGDQLRHCPRCRHPALIRPHQGRAACTDPACGFDFCTQCFSAFHHPRPCKPLSRAFSKQDVAGSVKSKKTLRRL